MTDHQPKVAFEVGCVSRRDDRVQPVLDVWDGRNGAGARLLLERQIHVILHNADGSDTPVICVYREREPAGKPVYEYDNGTLGSLIRAKLAIDDAIERMIRAAEQ